MKPIMNNEKLLECPFCGRDDVRMERDGRAWFVTCAHCEVSTGEYLNKTHAEKAWNTRAGHLYTADDYKQDSEERKHGL